MIVNANLNFINQLPLQKSKSGLYKNLIDIANLTNFSNQCSDYALKFDSSESLLPFLSFSVYIKHLFILRNVFPSNLIRHSVTQGAFKDIYRAFEL